MNGVFNIEVGNLLALLYYAQPNPCKHTRIHNYFSSFTWPKHLGGINGIGKDAFQKRSSIEGSFSPGHASDCMGVFGLLEVFLALEIGTTGDSKLNAALHCYGALCLLVRMLMSLPRGTVTADQLMKAVILHHRLFLQCYGDGEWVPKFHYCFHFAFHFAIHGYLIGCLALERKHKEPKREATVLANFNKTTQPERSILLAMVHSHFRSLDDKSTIPCSAAYLETPCEAGPGICKMLTSMYGRHGEICAGLSVRLEHFAFHQADFVSAKYPDNAKSVGQVLCNASFNGQCWSVIEIWNITPKVYCYARTAEVIAIKSERVLDTLVYSMHGDVAVVVPSNRM